MERLTSNSWANFDPWECCGQDYYCHRGCHEEGGCTNGCIVPKLYKRLAMYEDTGLAPDDIVTQSRTSPLTYEEFVEYCHTEKFQFDVRPVYILRDKLQHPHILIHGWRGVKDARLALDNYGYEYGKTWWAYFVEPKVR